MTKRKYNLILLILLTLILLCAINDISAVNTDDRDLTRPIQFNDNLRINNINSSQMRDSDFNLTDNSFNTDFENYQKENEEVSTVKLQMSNLNGSDFENNEKISINNTIQEEVEDSKSIYISPNGTSTIGTLENPSNWTYALSNIPDGGIIYFTTGTYQLYNQSITKNLTVSSCNGEVIINAGKQGTVFYILNSNNLFTVNGLTFYNGTGYRTGYTIYDIGYSGGSIFSKGTLVIMNSKFYENSVREFGGAVFSYGNIIVHNSSFINNYAYNMGSAVYSYNGSISVYDCEFINNTAIYSGVILAAVGNLNVSGSTFINNSMKVSACAKGKYVTVNNSTFINNHAKYDGAVINANNGFNITNSVLINNTADNGAQALYTSSGVGYANYNWWGNNTPFNGTNYNSQIQINGNFVKPDNWIIFSVNSVGNLIKPNLNYYTTGNNDYIFYGDGVIPERIVVFNDTENINSTTTTSSSKYLGTNKNLTASTDNQSISFSLILGDKFYVNNSYNGNSTGTIDQPFNNLSYAVEVANNQNNNVTLYIMNGVYNDVNMTITNNLTIMAYNNGIVTLDAKKNGYLFYVENGSLTVKNLNFYNGMGYDINGKTHGGAIYSNYNLTIINSTFKNNTANYGGSVCSKLDLIVINSIFTNNSADTGGAIFGQNSIINGSIFEYNTASELAGAIWIDNGKIRVHNSTFLNNKANLIGAIGADELINVTNSIFQNNDGGEYSGALFAGDISISLSTLYNNTGLIADDIYAVNSLYADYNWWGDNNPFNKTYNKIKLNNEKFTPYNWIIMELSINTDNFNTNDKPTLTVSLNKTLNTDGEINNLTTNITIPERTVIFTSDLGGIFNPNNIKFTNNTETLFYPNQSGKDNLHATIDNMTLNIPVNIIHIMIGTGITNEELLTNNGTVTVNVISNDGSIINTGSVNIFYNNKAIATAYVHDGKATLNINELPEGKYEVIVFYFGKDPYDSASKTLPLTVLANPIIDNSTILTGENLTKVYDEFANYTGKLVDAYGNPIAGQHIAINLTRLSDGASKIYWATTDTLGEYQLAINLSPGEYSAQASYYGKGNYSASNATVNSITVLKDNLTSTVLTANNFLEAFGAGLNFTGKLVDNLGSPVIGQHIALNLTRLDTGATKIYWVTTDTLGEYQLAINLWTANYTAQCSYGGTSQYAPSCANATITVTKA